VLLRWAFDTSHESHRGLLNGPRIEKRGMTSSTGFHEGIWIGPGAKF
jgi:hypothetical protein